MEDISGWAWLMQANPLKEGSELSWDQRRSCCPWRNKLQRSEFCQQLHKLGKGPWASHETPALATTCTAALWDPEQRTQLSHAQTPRHCETINMSQFKLLNMWSFVTSNRKLFSFLINRHYLLCGGMKEMNDPGRPSKMASTLPPPSLLCFLGGLLGEKRAHVSHQYLIWAFLKQRKLAILKNRSN